MTAGLQVWNGSHALQIDGENSHVILLRKGSAIGTALPNSVNSPSPAYSYVNISLNPGELLALNCPKGGRTCIAGNYRGQMQVHIEGAPGVEVDYWVFGPYKPSGIRYGMEIYDDNGTLIYDSGRLPLRVVKTITGSGTFTAAAPGRRCALICRQQNVSFQVLNYAVTQNRVSCILYFTAGFANIDSNGSVTISDEQYTADIQSNLDPNSLPDWWRLGGWNSSLDNSYVVVDVTDY